MTKGGHCLVAWPKVCLPKELGGLGISNLQNLSWALRMRWLWLKKTDPNRPWHMFHIPVHNCVQAFFSVAVISVVAMVQRLCSQQTDGLMAKVLLIWLLMSWLSQQKRKMRTVLEALTDHSWVRDIQGAMSAAFFSDYLALWDLISKVVLQPEVEDSHVWRFSSDGHYSAKFAYKNLLRGMVVFNPYKRIWKS